MKRLYRLYAAVLVVVLLVTIAPMVTVPAHAETRAASNPEFKVSIEGLWIRNVGQTSWDAAMTKVPYCNEASNTVPEEAKGSAAVSGTRDLELKIKIKNTGDISQFARLNLVKYFVELMTGEKDTTISPYKVDESSISIEYSNGAKSSDKSGVIVDTAMSTETFTYLYPVYALDSGESAIITLRLTPGDDNSPPAGFSRMFCQAQVDVIQIHNAAEAMLQSWGVDAEIDPINENRIASVNGFGAPTARWFTSFANVQCDVDIDTSIADLNILYSAEDSMPNSLPCKLTLDEPGITPKTTNITLVSDELYVVKRIPETTEYTLIPQQTSGYSVSPLKVTGTIQADQNVDIAFTQTKASVESPVPTENVQDPIFDTPSRQHGPINVTFVNEPVKEPDLFVSKTVESAVEGYAVPDDTFTFFAKVNGKAYANEYYLLSNGGAYEEYDEDGVAYKTDRYGRFYLKAGQTAKFPYIGRTASYEISEEAMDGYIIQPASGVISGVMQGMAASIEFKNIYVPTVDAPGKETDFRVYKHVLFPEGLHAPEGPDFTFELTLDGELHAGEEYSVYEEETERFVETRYTDHNGQFTLKAGQYAAFAHVLASTDYKVKEILPASGRWRTMGSELQQGPVTYPMTRVDFTNVEASLAVEKAIKDNVAADGEVFTFTLTDGTHKLSNVPYYLYSTSGYPVDDTVRTTTDDGQFDLEANQIAVLLGIDAAKTVTVKEEPHAGYEQVSPGSAGYQNIPVSDFPGTYRFVNTASALPGALTVIKTVRNATEVSAPETDVFSFVLEKETAGTYGPVSGVLYSITEGEAKFSYETGADGSFSLKAGQRAVFENMEVGAKYRVTEVMTGLSQAYSCLNEGMEEEVTLTAEGETVTFANLYSPDLTLNIKKVDFLDHALTLEGVEFELYRDAELTQKYASGKTDANGILTFDQLSHGTWYLVESSTVGKYVLPARPFVLTINHVYKETTYVNTPAIVGLAAQDSSSFVFIWGTAVSKYQMETTYRDRLGNALSVSGGNSSIIDRNLSYGNGARSKLKTPTDYLIDHLELHNNGETIPVYDVRLERTGSLFNYTYTWQYQETQDGSWIPFDNNQAALSVVLRSETEDIPDEEIPEEDPAVTATLDGGTIISIEGNSINVQIENKTDIVYRDVLPMTGGDGTAGLSVMGITLLCLAGLAIVWKKNEMGAY